jgi:hypothetical protein
VNEPSRRPSEFSDRISDAAARASLEEGFDRGRAVANIRARRLARLAVTAVVIAGAVGALGLGLAPSLFDEPSPSTSNGQHPDGDPNGPSLYDAWWGTCGTDPLAAFPVGPTDLFDLAVDLEPGLKVGMGVNLEGTATLTPLADSSVLTKGIDVLFLFDGRVVGSATSEDILQIQDFSEGLPVDIPLSTPITGCDGEGFLLPGDYTAVVSMGYTTDVDDPSDESGASPRVTAEPVAFTIVGDRSTNPLYQEPDPQYPGSGTPMAPPYPDNALSIVDLVSTVEAAADDSTWDLEPGTWRWSTSPTYSTQSMSIDNRCWLYNSLIDHVPEETAELDIISLEGSVPREIDLRYGWLVDTAPLVTVKLTNTTGSYLPGFQPYYGYGMELYLVKDGRVVAQSHLVDTTPWWEYEAQMSYLDTDVVADPADYYGLFAPHGVAFSRSVWVGVSPCRDTPNNIGFQSGTYTAVAALPFVDFYAPEYLPDELMGVLWFSLGSVDVTA